jgi:hypothetical protein
MRASLELREKDHEGKNVGMGAALCCQSAPHTTESAYQKGSCAQLLEGHAVNRIVGPNETITAERVRDWCAKHRLSRNTAASN